MMICIKTLFVYLIEKSVLKANFIIKHEKSRAL